MINDASTTATYYTASIDWNDGGTATSGTLASDGNGGFTVTGTHTFSSAGTYNPSVTISYAGRSEVITGAGVNVTSLSVTGGTLAGTLVQGGAFTGTVGYFTKKPGTATYKTGRIMKKPRVTQTNCHYISICV